MGSGATTGLRAEGVSKHFGGVAALDGVDFECARREVVGLIGPNGAGKTTLLNVLSAVDRSDRGSVSVDGDPMVDVPVHEAARRGVARTFQSVRLFRRLTVRQHVEVGAAAAQRSAGHDRPLLDVDLVLEALGLTAVAEQRAAQLPFALQRRVEIARALALSPRYLLLDEPAAGTNEVESTELARTVLSVRDLAGCGVVIVEHDLAFVFELSTRVYVLDEGRVLAHGPPAVVQRDPKVVEVYIGTTPGRRSPASNRDRGAEN